MADASSEKTFGMIKPDAVKRDLCGKILARYEAEGFHIRALRMKRLARHEAEAFYAEHKERPFFGELVDGMTAGPSIQMVLEAKDAISGNRKLMGATDPAKADAGTLRKEFGLNVGENSVHGSDSPASAKRELGFFFSAADLA